MYVVAMKLLAPQDSGNTFGGSLLVSQLSN
jgi:hypothetical protein